MKTVVILPTYNEAENISPLIDILEEEFKLISHQMQILVVDDDSPDGTADIVREKIGQYGNIELLIGQKEGLGAAYIRGMKYAMKKMGAEVVIEMDADFQHDPKDIKRLMLAIDQGCDYVLGSRFIAGGSIPKEWSLKRKFLSVLGNLFTRLVLGLWQIHDFTTGFKASRVRGFLDRINLDQVFSKSYAYKIHLLYQMIGLGARVKEVPIQFAPREKGSSKMDLEDFLESLRVVFKIRFDQSVVERR